MTGATTRNRDVVWIVASAVVAATVALAACLFVVVNTAIESEENLQAAFCVINALEKYVEAHDGKWPDSWNALTSVPGFECGGVAWPDDLGRIRNRVMVDFAVRSEDVVAGTTPVMTTIKVASPCYELSDADFQGLLAALRRYHRSTAM